MQYLILIIAFALKQQMEQTDFFKLYTLKEVLEHLNRTESFQHPSFEIIIGEVLDKDWHVTPVSLGVAEVEIVMHNNSSCQTCSGVTA